jgi:transketolase
VLTFAVLEQAIQDMKQRITDDGIDPKTVNLELEWENDGYSYSCALYTHVQVPKPEAELEKAYAKYYKQLAKYGQELKAYQESTKDKGRKSLETQLKKAKQEAARLEKLLKEKQPG